MPPHGRPERGRHEHVGGIAARERHEVVAAIAIDVTDARDSPYVNRASIFVITSMVRSAVFASVVSPPPDVPAHELEATIVDILLALLARSLRT